VVKTASADGFSFSGEVANGSKHSAESELHNGDFLFHFSQNLHTDQTIRLVARGANQVSIRAADAKEEGLGEPLKKRSATRTPVHKRKTLPLWKDFSTQTELAVLHGFSTNASA